MFVSTLVYPVQASLYRGLLNSGAVRGVVALPLAVGVATLLAQALGLSAEMLGSWLRTIPDVPPSPALPSITFGQCRELVASAAMVALLAGLESLRGAIVWFFVLLTLLNSYRARGRWNTLVPSTGSETPGSPGTLVSPTPFRTLLSRPPFLPC